MHCSGYCNACGTVHTLPTKGAQEKAKDLFHILEKKQTIDIFTDTNHDPRCSTKELFGEQRGKMFGVLECVDRAGGTVWLYAFSGQYNGLWQVNGWMPPLFDIKRFAQIHDPIEQRIKKLGRELAGHPIDSPDRKRLLKTRRQLSRDLMAQIHDLYTVHNSCGTVATLHQAFLHRGNKPTGTGDCCAPKLLNHAALSGLLPCSLAEFYFGKSNRSKTREHGRFYLPCKDKCQPLLGFLLCGLDQKRHKYVT